MKFRRIDMRLMDGRNIYLYEFEEDVYQTVEQRQTKFWSIAAHAWEAESDHIEKWLMPVTSQLVDAMPNNEESLILDAGCGRCNLPLLNRVIGVDIAPAMLDSSKRVVRGSCITLPFTSDSFDGAISRFALMLAPSPSAALCELRRVLKPGAPLAFSVWGPSSRNGWRAPEEVISQHLGVRSPEPDEPHIWRLSDSGEVEHLIEQAGLTCEQFEPVQLRYLETLSAEEAFDLIVALSGGLSNLWERIPAAEKPAVREAAIEALKDRRGEAHVYVCRKRKD